MKKLLSLIVCLAMVFGLATSAFASATDTLVPGADSMLAPGAGTPVGGGADAETPGGSDSEIAGGAEADRPGGSDSEIAGGGSDAETPGGGSDSETPGGGSDSETPGGGSDSETPGGGSDSETPGGGSDSETPGGGSDSETPGGSGAETPDIPVVTYGTLTINGASLNINMSKVGYNVEDPDPDWYALLIYTSEYSGKELPDKNKDGKGGWNRYGVAIVVAKDGTVVAVYDGSYGKIWSNEHPNGFKDDNVFQSRYYAEAALAARQGDEVVIIAPSGVRSSQEGSKNFVYNNTTGVCAKNGFMKFEVSGMDIDFDNNSSDSDTPGGSENEGTDTPGGSENEGTDTPGGSENEGTDTPGGSENEGTDTPGGSENEGTDTPGGSENEGSDSSDTGDGILMFFLLMAMSAIAMVSLVFKKSTI